MAGQRQLLGVARALLREARVVIMDEPSSNVDEQTDAALQKALRNAFREIHSAFRFFSQFIPYYFYEIRVPSQAARRRS